MVSASNIQTESRIEKSQISFYFVLFNTNTPWKSMTKISSSHPTKKLDLLVFEYGLGNGRKIPN